MKTDFQRSTGRTASLLPSKNKRPSALLAQAGLPSFLIRLAGARRLRFALEVPRPPTRHD